MSSKTDPVQFWQCRAPTFIYTADVMKLHLAPAGIVTKEKEGSGIYPLIQIKIETGNLQMNAAQIS